MLKSAVITIPPACRGRRRRRTVYNCGHETKKKKEAKQEESNKCFPNMTTKRAAADNPMGIWADKTIPELHAKENPDKVQTATF